MSEDLYTAAVAGNLDQVRRLVAPDPAIVGSTVEWGFTALHGVAGEEHLEIAAYLLDQGADPNAGNDEGITPLHLAADPAMVELLVERGAQVDARSNDGSTPLLIQAAEAESIDVMAALLQLGANPAAKDNLGRTALAIARSREEDDKIELLQGPSKPRWKFW